MINLNKKPIQINLSQKAFEFLRDCMKVYMVEYTVGGDVAQEVIDELEL